MNPDMGKASRRKRDQRSGRLHPKSAANNVFVLHRLSSSLSKDQLIHAVFPLWKFGWIEEARTLAKKTADGYEVLQDFLDSAAAERYCDNLRRHRIEHIPEPFAKEGFVPLAQVMPELTGVLATMLAEDADVALSIDLSTAKRMETKPTGDYLFPDLSPEAYAEVLKLRQKKPN
jgi:hypothetical protein